MEVDVQNNGVGVFQAYARRTIACLGLLVGGLCASVVNAGSIEEFVSAYEQGRFVEALEGLKPLADSGDAVAERVLAHAYSHGNGIKNDPEIGYYWYQRAAMHGDSQAQTWMGKAFEDGILVQKSSRTALDWYTKAADQGHKQALNALGVMYYSGDWATKDLAKAAALFRQAAEQGLTVAQYNLGTMYRDGVGIEQSPIGATFWFARASWGGDEKALKELSSIQRELLELRIKGKRLNLRENAARDAKVLMQLTPDMRVFSMGLPYEGWQAVYTPHRQAIGFVSADLVETHPSELAALEEEEARQRAAQAAQFPARPAPRDGYVTCNTRCVNASCWRTYSDGRQVQFTARQVWDPFESRFKNDSGGC